MLPTSNKNKNKNVFVVYNNAIIENYVQKINTKIIIMKQYIYTFYV